MKKNPKPSKFRLYEECVQSPNWQVDYLPQFHTWLTGKTPRKFREDFCGSARVACEWVKRDSKNSALGLDLDQEVLDYAKRVNLASLGSKTQNRIKLKCADVRKSTTAKFDWIGAFNFSVFEFHERKELLRYFKAAHQSLERTGTLFLEVAGGPGFLEASLEKQTKPVPGLGRVTHAWEQSQFDPITAVNDYAIHFKLPDGTWIHQAFAYHWRIWGIRELRDALQEAGFKRSVVLWEKADASGAPLHEFLPMDAAPNHDFFIAYVVGLK
ncbi:MAG: class I SAM-dependent methyltransferase [Bdellovibrionales bacterium]|nr:class I SAM-dependent methyltransferase [Bdellovibrionales bacterium]